MYKRGRIWWFSYVDDNGKQQYRSTETSDRKLAEKIVAKFKVLRVEGKWFDFEKGKEHIYDEMMDRFIKDYAPNKTIATQQMYRYARKHLDNYFSGFKLVDINEDMILTYMKKRRTDDKASPATVNREFSTLAKAFSEAWKVWKWIKSNPCALVSKFPENNIKYIWLNAEQERILVETARKGGYLNGDLADIIIFAINSGMRREEILSLKIQQINMQGKTITAFETKNKEPRTIPMNNTLEELLKKRLSKCLNINGYLFFTSTGNKYSGGNVLKSFKLAVDKADKAGAGIGHFWFHGLRHTFGTRLAQAGMNTRQIGELMGIKNEKVLKRYTHFSVESLRSVVKVLDGQKSENMTKI